MDTQFSGDLLSAHVEVVAVVDLVSVGLGQLSESRLLFHFGG